MSASLPPPLLSPEICDFLTTCSFPTRLLIFIHMQLFDLDPFSAEVLLFDLDLGTHARSNFATVANFPVFTKETEFILLTSKAFPSIW